MKLLHIYAQSTSHEEAWVVGNRDGLTTLRDAIDAALAKGSSSEIVSASDNEEYKILVVEAETATLDSREVGMPYTNAYHKGGKHPIVLIGPARYRELMKSE